MTALPRLEGEFLVVVARKTPTGMTKIVGEQKFDNTDDANAFERERQAAGFWTSYQFISVKEGQKFA